MRGIGRERRIWIGIRRGIRRGEGVRREDRGEEKE
jgi:hypothetical protein